MRFSNFLGQRVACLLNAEPFKSWPAERSVYAESDPPEVGYTFVGYGLAVKCDGHDERVSTIFLEAESLAGKVLSEVSFRLRRDEVLALFGTPSKSGAGLCHPILGNSGPWDRFHGPEYTMHFQYQVNSDNIAMVTLMRNDVVP